MVLEGEGEVDDDSFCFESIHYSLTV